MRRPSGFTTIELLVATALAAVMMLAVLQVTASIGRVEAAFDQGVHGQPWRRNLLDTIRWDLVNARRITVKDKQLLLEGYGGLDTTTLNPSHRPTLVVYEVISDGERSWLLRRQTDTSQLTKQYRSSNLVCEGVKGIEVQILDKLEQGVPTAIPKRVRLIVKFDNQDVGIMNRMIFIR